MCEINYCNYVEPYVLQMTYFVLQWSLFSWKQAERKKRLIDGYCCEIDFQIQTLVIRI